MQYNAIQPSGIRQPFKTKSDGCVIWLTGLSGSGKTTIGKMLTQYLNELGLRAEFLDGDELRNTISNELGFSKQDRETHVKRVAYLSYLLSKHGVITVVALISPYRSFRQYARNLVGDFVEVWVKCSLETCKRRDPKGLYRSASYGTITNMTGLQSPYEAPNNPEIIVNTEKETSHESVSRIIKYLENERALK